MKFYKLSLMVMLPILLVAAIFVIMGIQYTFKTSESDNNQFYSKMIYNMFNEYISNQIDRTSNGIFSDKEFYQIRNEMIYRSASSQNTSLSIEKEAIPDLASQYGFKYYYVENNDKAPYSNAPYELTMAFLSQDSGSFSKQTFIYNYGGDLYIGIMKNLFTSNSDDNAKTYLVMAPLKDVVDLENMMGLVGIQDVEYITKDMIENRNEANMALKSDGFINISDKNFNQVYVPIHLTGKSLYYLSAKIDKPEIIVNLRRQTILIIASVFLVLVFSSIMASLLLKKIAGQINNTIKKVDQIANGHYEIDLEYKGIDEIRQLSNSINKLSATINDKILELNYKNEETLNIMIEALNATDSYTKGHSDRVSKYVQIIGQAMGYDDLKTLEKASLVHDIGKITIPEQILNKKGPLTDSEFQVIQEHSLTGFKILHKASAFSEVDNLVLHHHEKYDGSGYPNQLAGEEIPLGAQILSIADVYDALTSHRPYRRALSHREAITTITSSMRNHFSDRLIETFMAVEPQLEVLT